MLLFFYIAVGYRCVARYYESAIGRFTTIDPLAEKYYSWSPYVYVTNNPLKYIDPDGRSGVLTLPIRVARHGRNMYRAAKAFLVGSSAVATGTAYNHYLSQEQAQQAQQGFLNTVTERATEIKAQEVVAELNKNLPPDLRWVRGQEKAAEAWGEAQKITHTESVNNNLPDPNKEDGGGPKRNLKKWEKIVTGTISGAGLIQQITNPKPNKNAAEAHQEVVEEKLKQVPQDPPRQTSFFEWLIKKFND